MLDWLLWIIVRWPVCTVNSSAERKVRTILRRKPFQGSSCGSVMKSKQTALGSGGRVTACDTLINCLHFVSFLFKYWPASTWERKEGMMIINYAGCACQPVVLFCCRSNRQSYYSRRKMSRRRWLATSSSDGDHGWGVLPFWNNTSGLIEMCCTAPGCRGKDKTRRGMLTDK